MDILKYFKDGYNTRKELSIRTGLSDRKVRDEIERARRKGTIILNNQDGKGYFISEDLEDLRNQYKQNNNRAMSILVQQKFIRRKIKELERSNINV